MAKRRVGRRDLFTRLLSVTAGAVRDEQEASCEVSTADRLSTELEPSLEPVEGDAAPRSEQIVRIHPAACIAYRGTLCTVCVERCPEPGAIVLDFGRPKVVSEVCTGCGDCVARCPAPVTAMTLRDR